MKKKTYLENHGDLKYTDICSKIAPGDLLDLPIEEASTIPASWSVLEDFHQFDLQQVLLPSWQYVCHVSDVAERGDQFGCEVLGKPVLIVRTGRSDDSVKAFANVCRHRGGPLALGKQNGRLLRCMYHAWTYTLEGELLGVPKSDGMQDLEKKECSLPSIACAVYGNMVFVNFAESPEDKHPQSTISSVFSEVATRIAPIDLSSMRFYHRQIYDVACNWKVYIENYMEGYHIDAIHPELATILDMKGYTTECSAAWVLQTGPIKNSVNPYNAASGSAYYYFLFPNMMLNILPGRMQVNCVIPVSADRCKVIFDYCYDDAFFKKDMSQVVSEDSGISDLVQAQDAGICAAVQKGLSSGFYQRGRYVPREELGIYYFHRLLREAYRSSSR